MRLALAVTIGAAAVCAAGSARADAYDATLTRAIAAKERAMDVNEPARWEEALRLFQEADAIRATREASYELGHAAERLARTDLAVEAYEAALNLGLTGQPRSKAEAFVGAHAAALARVQIRGSADGRVRSGGIDCGRLPLRRPLVLFPGETVIEIIDSQGHRTPHRLKLTAGQLEILDISSSPSQSPSPAPSRPPPPPVILSPPPEPPPASPPLTPTPPAPPPPPPPPEPSPAAESPDHRLVVRRRRPCARGGQRRDGGGVIQPHRRRAR